MGGNRGGGNGGNATISVHNPAKKIAEMIYPVLLAKPARSGASTQALVRGHHPATQQGASPSVMESKCYRAGVCHLACHSFIVNDGGVPWD